MRNRWRTAAFGLVMVSLAAGTAAGGDWASWRGPEQSGYSAEKNLPGTWSPEGENLLWKAPVSVRSTPLILNDRVYAIGGVGEGEHRQERVIALDLDTGKVVWEHPFNVFHTDIVFHRLGWANPVGDPETGNVYTHGVQGLLLCFDKDGAILWSHSMTEEFGRISGYGGRVYTPIIEGDLLIFSALSSSWGAHGKGAHRFIGMDKRTGEVRWVAEAGGTPTDTGYAVPVVHTLDGARAMFVGLADGSVAAMRPTTGELLWRFPLSRRALMGSVVYADGRVYAVHGDTNIDGNEMGRLVCLDARTGKELWRVSDFAGQYATPILHDGVLYAVDDAALLRAIDAETGTNFWSFEYGNEAKGSPVLADGKIYAGDVARGWNILEITPAGCERLSVQTFRAPNGAPEEIFASAAVGHGRVVLATIAEMYCISLEKPGFRSPDPPLATDPLAAPGPVARIQVEPADAWLAPGESRAFHAAGFDARGRRIGEVPASFSLSRLQGNITADGVFTAAGNRIQAGGVTATAGDLEAEARVRVFPPIPYDEDFEHCPINLPPAGWITSKLKAVVDTDETGNRFLRKLADNPASPIIRMDCFIMPPLPAGYTVAADLRGQSKKNRFLPDMGLINARYRLIMVGTSETTRRVRLVSWTPMPRVMKEVEFPWKGDTWYRAELSVAVKDGKAFVRGKVWPRGEAKPHAWTVELVDTCPNTEGSPGLLAAATAVTERSPGTEIWFDNVSIAPNAESSK
jgi:outer membrane protein assembly factor BamB